MFESPSRPPLPPARTRRDLEGGIGPDVDGNDLLAPVRSGLYASPEPATAWPEPAMTRPEPPPAPPAFDYSGTIESDSPAFATFEPEPFVHRPEASDATAEAVTSYEDFEFGDEGGDLVLEFDAGDGDEVLLLEADLEGVEIIEDADPMTLTFTTEMPGPEEALTPQAAPLSPWDLEAAGDQADRAREEWESLGEALSLTLQPETGEPLAPALPPVETDVPDAWPEAPEADADSELEPISAWSDPAEPPADEPDEAVPGLLSLGESLLERDPVRPRARTRYDSSPALDELAARLETFARALRDDGAAALSRAERHGDRIDTMLAAIAAGFLAGRGE